MSANDALARTLDLVQSDIFPFAGDGEIVAALIGTRIRLSADERNLASPAGQTALVTAAVAAAQCGVELVLAFPDAPLVAAQPPLKGECLRTALLELTDDLITPAIPDQGEPVDLTIAFGSTRVSDDDRVARLSPLGDGRGFEFVPTARGGEIWTGAEPWGALLGGIAAGAEAFRVAMRTLTSRHRAQLPHAARDLRAVRLALRSGELNPELGAVDIVSAGAITNAMLFTLFRIPRLAAALRVFDDDAFDVANLNRYPLGRRSLQGQPKVDVLAALSTRSVTIDPVARRFDADAAREHKLMDLVAVGVDDIPSRWLAQEHAPGTVVVGATSHFEVAVSEHPPGKPCAGCLYRNGENDGRPIPTVSFVSALAGVLQAWRLVAADGVASAARQWRAAPVNLAGAEPVTEFGIAPRRDCPVDGCRAGNGVAGPGTRSVRP
jgi:molybdopterin/thiamine biosynthesis adenylyltransferase